jgi:hypothetical protein
MDGTRFDQLIKSLATQRVSRLTALRGLAAGAVASVTGLSLFGEEGEAKKGKKTRKRRICHRTSASDPGVSKKLKAKKAKKHLKNHPFDTKGRCAAAPAPTTTLAPPAPGTQCAVDQDCDGGLVCRGGRCGFCNNNQECPGDQVCIEGQCRGGLTDFRFRVGGEDCSEFPHDPCPFPLSCLEEEPGSDHFCLFIEMTYDGHPAGACPPLSTDVCEDVDINGTDVATTCVLGACVLPCGATCEDAGGECFAGICFGP